MFTKLNKKFDHSEYKVTTRHIDFLMPLRSTGELRGTYYDNIELADKEKYLQILPKKYWSDFMLTLLTIDHYIPPHTDSNVTASINFYIETHNCHTFFFIPKGNEVKGYKGTDTQTNGKLYNSEDLIEIGNFVAEPGDCYVFDPKVIHSVAPNKLSDISIKLSPTKPRKAISLVTNLYSYEEVLEMCRETGNL